MSLKTAFSPRPELAETASKFLFFMAFVRSASNDTIRSYRSDLRQAFGLKEEELPRVEEIQAGSEPNSRPGSSPSRKPQKLEEGSLMEACRAALHGWATLAPASRNRKAATLKSFLGWLYEEGAIDRDLALHIHSPKVPVRLPHHLSVDEAMALLKSLQSGVQGAGSSEEQSKAERDLALVLLLYGGGLRVSEACVLTWAQLEKSGRVARIKGKGSKERLVALPPLAASAVMKLPRTGAFVFGETPLSTRVAYEIVRTRGAQAGLLQPLHPHALRHSFATHLLSSGANLRTLQELLGHQTLQATQRYTHLGIDQLARTLESFHPLGSEAGSSPSTKKPRS
jgi:integrase/recombinase XerC/integrase/recombinase XerD